MKVVVTGGSGRVGCWVRRELRNHGHQVTSVDRRLPPQDEEQAEHRQVDAADVGAMSWVLQDADAVVHLAAIPGPGGMPPQSVFVGNVAATFAVLQAAALVGVAKAVVASSISILGLAFSPRLLRPAYLPVDETHPLLIEDPYALSKAADEATAQMFSRLGIPNVFALRFHGVLAPDYLAEAFARTEVDPGNPGHQRGLWGYVDARDVAQACRLAVEASDLEGCHVLNICAPDTTSRLPTAELLERWLPDVDVRGKLDGRQGLWDIDRARRLLGYQPLPYEPSR